MTEALSPYPDPERRERHLDLVAARAGASVEHFGDSVEGRPLRVVRVPSSASAPARVLCCANIHGPEYVGNRVAMGVLEALAGDAASARAVRERAEIWVAPCVNPDGYAKTWDLAGEGPLRVLRKNARGVDLNRNFPLPAGASPSRLPFTGSSDPAAATYRGERPLSEPETAALEALFHAGNFHASVNLHSFMGTLISPRVSDRDHFDLYRYLGQRFQAAQTKYRYRRLGSWYFDAFTGEQEDHQHAAHGTWAVCVESFPVAASYRQHLRAPSTFWRFNPRDPGPWVENDVPAVLAWLAAALELERPVTGDLDLSRRA